MTAWILKLMQLLVVHAPWEATFPETAAAIDKIAHEAPLYDGENGVVETAAELVALTYYESKFDARAVGGDGTSLGLAQIHISNLRDLEMTHDQLFDPESNLRAAIKLLKISHRICKSRPKADRLANYASGGPTCSVPEGLDASRRRMRLAADILRKHPPVWTDHTPPPMKKPPRGGGTTARREPEARVGGTRRRAASRAQTAAPRATRAPRSATRCAPARADSTRIARRLHPGVPLHVGELGLPDRQEVVRGHRRWGRGHLPGVTSS